MHITSAAEFLSLFNHKIYTLGRLKQKELARTFAAVPAKLSDALSFLENHNQENKEDIYFMVNEGNGVYNEKKTACHGSDKVIGLSALFVDAELPEDADPLPYINSFCESYFTTPSIIVETSKNRYHIYWLLDSTEIRWQTIKQWKQLQAFLNGRLSMDRTMTDLPQLLRIPFFYNNAKECVVSVKDYNGFRYSLEFLYEKIKSHFPEIDDQQTFEPLKTVTESYKVPAGERHEELMRRARKLYSLPLTDAEIKCFVDGFIQNHIDDNEDFRPTGKRYSEVTRILSSAKTYAEKERVDEAVKAVQSIQSNRQRDPFELDPDFYYQAPGLVGDLTRHIVDTSDFPIPAHAYAAAVSLVGFTKARYIHGARSLPPLNYFICLAPAGSGKTSIQHVVKEAFQSLEIQHLMEDGISSAQGLLQFLSESHNLGFIMYDEVKDLFQTISNRNAASYEFKIATELTKLYTAYKSTYTPPTTKSHRGKKVILNRPLFAFLGYGHHTLIESMFTKANVMEGLLPRFIILNVGQRTEKPTRYKPIPEDIIAELRHHVTRSALAVEKQADDHDIQIAPDIQRRQLKLTIDAQRHFQEFRNNCSLLYNNAVSEKNGLEALFSRGVEQSLRLSLAMADNEIHTPVLKFSTDLISAQMNSFYTRFSEVVDRSQSGKDLDELYGLIVDLCAKSPDGIARQRDIQRKVQHRYKDSRLFTSYMKALIEQERICSHEVKLPSGQLTKGVILRDTL